MNRENITTSNLLMLAMYLGVFFLLDHLNMSYQQMMIDYSIWLVIANILLNILMSLLSTYLFILGSKNIKRAKAGMLGRNMSEIAVLFGILTYGCTPCVISFFATFSIPFVAVALPLAGLPYKLISLLLILLGIWLVKKESKKTSCTIDKGEN